LTVYLYPILSLECDGIGPGKAVCRLCTHLGAPFYGPGAEDFLDRYGFNARTCLAGVLMSTAVHSWHKRELIGAINAQTVRELGC
jgi:hypothetical protein